jgi:hypothetical protein
MDSDKGSRGSELSVWVRYDLFGIATSALGVTDEGAALGPQVFAPGRIVPPVFTATIDDPAMPFIVRMKVHVNGSNALIDALSLHRWEGDPPIGSRALRHVPIKRYLAAALVKAQLKIEETSPGHYQISPRSEKEEDELGERAATTASRRRVRVTDPDEIRAEIERAGQLRAEALSDEEQRRRSTLYVAERMHVSRAKAARLLKSFDELGEG